MIDSFERVRKVGKPQIYFELDLGLHSVHDLVKLRHF